jgi:chemotaxis regulatin CheY-phosphate phosphatase CheZ
MKLVTELEGTLVNLVRLSSGEVNRKTLATDGPKTSHGFGPAVPGVTQGIVVSGQQDVDALLSGLGM